ncbi:hypothetical protein ACJX0J_017969, partial [Zea mays]
LYAEYLVFLKLEISLFMESEYLPQQHNLLLVILACRVMQSTLDMGLGRLFPHISKTTFKTILGGYLDG